MVNITSCPCAQQSDSVILFILFISGVICQFIISLLVYICLKRKFCVSYLIECLGWSLFWMSYILVNWMNLVCSVSGVNIELCWGYEVNMRLLRLTWGCDLFTLVFAGHAYCRAGAARPESTPICRGECGQSAGPSQASAAPSEDFPVPADANSAVWV